MNKQQAAKAILKEVAFQRKEKGSSYAPANIALCKYWGKRDEELNLPVTSSLSISLGHRGAHTELQLTGEEDSVWLNDRELSREDPFTRRIVEFLDLVRPDDGAFFRVSTRSTIPVAAGLASSAAGFAALVLSLDDLFQWHLEPRRLSLLARLGSGSACRSMYTGFVEWRAGDDVDGMDSFAEPLKETWPELRIGLLNLSSAPKPIGSRPAMKTTVETSELYRSWPAKAARDLAKLKQAIQKKDFEALGMTAESNALAMHATMMAAWPPVVYWLPESVVAMQNIWSLRQQGLRIYFTMDAGPNVKLVFLERDLEGVRQAFNNVEPIAPFAG